MKVYGVNAAGVGTVIRDVSHARYEDNLIAKSCEDRSNSKGGRAVFTLQVIDSHRGRPGAIGVPGRTGEGPHGMKRRSNAACWHAHWDVVEELLRRYPDARVTSGFRLRDVAVTYTADTFRETALATAHLDVGRGEPITMPQCCECDHTRYTDVPPEVDHELSRPARRASGIPSWMPGSYARSIYRDTDRQRRTVEYGEGVETSYAETNGGRNEPHPDLSGYYYNYREQGSGGGGTYPWDAIPAARPWVKPGRTTVDDTLSLIDEITNGGTGSGGG